MLHTRVRDRALYAKQCLGVYIYSMLRQFHKGKRAGEHPSASTITWMWCVLSTFDTFFLYIRVHAPFRGEKKNKIISDAKDCDGSVRSYSGCLCVSSHHWIRRCIICRQTETIDTRSHSQTFQFINMENTERLRLDSCDSRFSRLMRCLSVDHCER